MKQWHLKSMLPKLLLTTAIESVDNETFIYSTILLTHYRCFIIYSLSVLGVVTLLIAGLYFAGKFRAKKNYQFY